MDFRDRGEEAETRVAGAETGPAFLPVQLFTHTFFSVLTLCKCSLVPTFGT